MFLIILLTFGVKSGCMKSKEHHSLHPSNIYACNSPVVVRWITLLPNRTVVALFLMFLLNVFSFLQKL